MSDDHPLDIIALLSREMESLKTAMETAEGYLDEMRNAEAPGSPARVELTVASHEMAQVAEHARTMLTAFKRYMHIMAEREHA